MKKFIVDIFSEEAPEGATGKGSAKRFMGITVGLLAAIGAILGGLHWYKISPEILNPMWTYSAVMLGVSVAKGILSK